MSSKSKRPKLDIQQDQENLLVDDDNEFRLHPELWQMILTNAVLLQMYSKHTVKRQEDKSIFNGLASVAFRWFMSLKTRNFKNKIRHFSKVYFQRAKLRSTIIRQNRNFLKEVIDPDKIMFPLESCGCLTEVQVAFLARLRNHKDKKHELLIMLQDSSSHKYSKCVDCLFATNQTPAALVLERGGDTVKVHINNGKSTRTREFEMELIKRIQRMQTENTLILIDLLNVSVGKRLNDTFLIHAMQNKGIELWFWCRTKRSLNELKRSTDDDLREIIQCMYRCLIPEHSALLEPQLIQMDYCLASDFAERRLSIRHIRDREHLIDLKFSQTSQRFGCIQLVTALADKIYVVQNRGEISVYWKKHPYTSLKSIVLSSIGSPFQIASCNKNKCLYVSLTVNDHVLKVEPMLDNRVSEWLYKTGVLITSVTSKGDVLVLKVGSGDLQIITHAGTVKRTISIDDRFSVTRFIQEIMPDIVALSYVKPLEITLRCIAIMSLDENGTVLRIIEWPEPIGGISSFRYGDLFVDVSRHLNVKANFLLSLLGSKGYRYMKLQHWTLESKVVRNLLMTNTMAISIHFDADQKQLYVLSRYKLEIYQLRYEDEVYN